MEAKTTGKIGFENRIYLKGKEDVQQDDDSVGGSSPLNVLKQLTWRDGENIARQPWDIELSTLNYNMSVMPNKIKIYHGW